VTWPQVAIGTLGQIYDGPHATPKSSDEGPIFLGIKNITEDGRLDLSEIRHIAEDDYPRWIRRVEPKPGDIVFIYEAGLNRYAVVPEGFRGCLGRRTALIRLDSQKADSRFLLYYFLGEEWRQTIARNIWSGATVDRIPLTNFPAFPVTLPPLATQRKIAAVLSSYDDLIENNTRRIAILEQIARLLYREWFVDFRFPGHEEVPAADSRLGPIPNGWEIRYATDALLINPTTTLPRDGLKPFVPMSALSNNSMLISGFEMRAGNSGAKFRNGDTLFARITPCLENGKTAFVQFLPTDDTVAFGSTEFIVLRPKTLNPEFVYLIARSDAFRDNAIKSMSGATGRQRVRETCFATFEFPHPPQGLLQLFHDRVYSIFAAIQTLDQQNANLRQTRDLLLPRLISGEVDVENLDINTEGLAA